MYLPSPAAGHQAIPLAPNLDIDVPHLAYPPLSPHTNTAHAHQQPSPNAILTQPYPSPPTSIASTASYGHAHSISVGSTFDLPATSFAQAQLPPSSGPSRPLTRRQRAQLEQHGAGTRHILQSPFQQLPRSHLQTMYALQGDVSNVGDETGVAMSPGQMSPDHAQAQQQHAMAQQRMMNMQMQNPGAYHPLTPTPSSASSSYSPYHPYSIHSRSNSNSLASHPRSASPALSHTSSHTSALTSISAAFSPGAHAPSDPRAKQKKQKLLNIDRKQICLYAQHNPHCRQEDIAQQWGVERSTISKILKHKTKWLNVPDHEYAKVAKHRLSKFPQVEEQMLEWLRQCAREKTSLTDSLIRQKAKQVAASLNLAEDKFKASSGWIENFKNRHGIRGGRFTGSDQALQDAGGPMPKDGGCGGEGIGLQQAGEGLPGSGGEGMTGSNAQQQHQQQSQHQQQQAASGNPQANDPFRMDDGVFGPEQVAFNAATEFRDDNVMDNGMIVDASSGAWQMPQVGDYGTASTDAMSVSGTSASDSTWTTNPPSVAPPSSTSGGVMAPPSSNILASSSGHLMASPSSNMMVSQSSNMMSSSSGNVMASPTVSSVTSSSLGGCVGGITVNRESIALSQANTAINAAIRFFGTEPGASLISDDQRRTLFDIGNKVLEAMVEPGRIP